jgi:hypothetical protein
VRRCHAALPNWTLILKFSVTVMSTCSTRTKLGATKRANKHPHGVGVSIGPDHTEH